MKKRFVLEGETSPLSSTIGRGGDFAHMNRPSNGESQSNLDVQKVKSE